jgi:predicted tellurium resistance membrane protein TerC
MAGKPVNKHVYILYALAIFVLYLPTHMVLMTIAPEIVRTGARMGVTLICMLLCLKGFGISNKKKRNDD